MAIRDIFKVSRKTFFSPGSWIGYEGIKENTIYTWEVLKGLFVVPTAVRKETFSEAKARLKLTDADIKEAEVNYFFYALLFAGCAIITLIGSLAFLIKYNSFGAFLLALAVSAIFGAQAFRSHFLYFQIKVRKLGCTYQEWKHFLLNGSGK